MGECNVCTNDVFLNHKNILSFVYFAAGILYAVADFTFTQLEPAEEYTPFVYTYSVPGAYSEIVYTFAGEQAFLQAFHPALYAAVAGKDPLPIFEPDGLALPSKYAIGIAKLYRLDALSYVYH